MLQENKDIKMRVFMGYKQCIQEFIGHRDSMCRKVMGISSIIIEKMF
jgi:hypothetical protein